MNGGCEKSGEQGEDCRCEINMHCFFFTDSAEIGCCNGCENVYQLNSFCINWKNEFRSFACTDENEHL